MNFTTGKFTVQTINLILLGILIAIAVWVYRDCRKHGLHVYDSLLWGLIVLFLLPPVGLLVYLFYKRRQWT